MAEPLAVPPVGLERAQPEVPDEALRPALEAAVLLAQRADRADPPIDVPAALRRFLHFAKLPGSALGAVRKAVESDEAYRSRLALAAREDLLGRPSYLWLARPEGWEQGLAEVARASAEASSAAEDERAERTARRRLKGAEEATRRAEADAQRAKVDSESARMELLAERTARREAEARATKLDARLRQLEAEVANVRRRLDGAEAELTQVKAAPPAVPALAEAAGPAAADTAAAAPAEAGLDRAAVAEVLAEVARSSEAMAEALGRLAALAGAADAAAAVQGEAPARRSAPAPRPASRQPLRLPGGVFDDSREAADHLVRASGVILLVDGYNASKLAWPDLTLGQQRDRLVAALGELHLRIGVETHVVFDGAEAGGIAPSTRNPVRVTFSPTGVEADDVLIGLVREYPLDRPVVVASSDRRVRDGARAGGANVVSSHQLLDVLHR